jgi:hypothetical protein
MQAEFDTFASASAHAKALRNAKPADGQTRIKLMFATSPQGAEELLLQVRQAGPSGDE